MNASRWKHLLPVVLTIALFAAVSPARAGVSDAWITTKVKMLLLNSPSVGGMAINVDTDDGRVTLHGKVDTRAERTEPDDCVLQAATSWQSTHTRMITLPTTQAPRPSPSSCWWIQRTPRFLVRRQWEPKVSTSGLT